MIFGEKINTYAAIIGPEACDTDVVLSLTRLPLLQVHITFVHESCLYVTLLTKKI